MTHVGCCCEIPPAASASRVAARARKVSRLSSSFFGSLFFMGWLLLGRLLYNETGGRWDAGRIPWLAGRVPRDAGPVPWTKGHATRDAGRVPRDAGHVTRAKGHAS